MGERRDSYTVLVGKPEGKRPIMYINQQDAQNSVIRLYFPLHALNVSDYISPKHLERLMENKV